MRKNQRFEYSTKPKWNGGLFIYFRWEQNEAKLKARKNSMELLRSEFCHRNRWQWNTLVPVASFAKLVELVEVLQEVACFYGELENDTYFNKSFRL